MNQLIYNKNEAKQFLQFLADKHSFIAVGVAKARKLIEEEDHLRAWLDNGYFASMKYMQNHFEKRLDPTLLVPGAKTVLTFLYNYYPEQQQKEGAPKIAKYAYGEDYHSVIKDKLYELVVDLEQKTGKFGYRIFVDSAPVMERQWAALSGLGWIGKNSLLLRKSHGSFFFIATIICDIDLEEDAPTTDHCGTCNACIDACPTQAIIDNGIIDSNLCISHATIELKDNIPDTVAQQSQNWIFGCDICQDVCPWNRFSQQHTESRFTPTNDWISWDNDKWQNVTEQEFGLVFQKSAILRAGYQKIKQTLKSVQSNEI